MTSLLSGSPASPEEQHANNGHRAWAPVAVLLALAIFSYLFTPVHAILGLPAPQTVAELFGLGSLLDFDGGSLYCDLIEEGHGQRLFFFVSTAFMFLWVYFSPLGWKQPSLVLWFLIAGCSFFGYRAILGLLCAHLLVYLCYHPRAARTREIAFLAGVVGAIAFTPGKLEWVRYIILVVPTALVAGLLVRFIHQSLIAKLCAAGGRGAKLLRLAVIQSPLLTVCIGALFEGFQGKSWILPLGIVFFFWQWERLMMYAVDYKDGLVPEQVPLTGYLSVFLSPGVIPNFEWGVTIAQGYGYAASKFLRVDKNRLVLKGLGLWAIALCYLACGRPCVEGLAELISRHVVPVEAGVQWLVRSHTAGLETGTGSILLSSLLDQLGWFFVWGGVLHFKVGLWRVLGYDIDPYFRFPLLATNLVSLWTRFTFHYREFLVRVFYYPIFFRLARQKTWLRVAVATTAAAGVGNLIWGHLCESMYSYGIRYENFAWTFRSWPYFALLTAGITLTELWLLWKPRRIRRKPWTPGWRIALDLLAVYLTFQYYALIHVFYYQWPGASLWDHALIFFRGLGLDLS